MLGCLAHDLAQGGHRLAPLAGAELAGPRNRCTELRHLHVVGDVAQKAFSAGVCNQGMDRVAADVDRCQAHDRPTLNSFA